MYSIVLYRYNKIVRHRQATISTTSDSVLYIAGAIETPTPSICIKTQAHFVYRIIFTLLSASLHWKLLLSFGRVARSLYLALSLSLSFLSLQVSLSPQQNGSTLIVMSILGKLSLCQSNQKEKDHLKICFCHIIKTSKGFIHFILINKTNTFSIS